MDVPPRCRSHWLVGLVSIFVMCIINLHVNAEYLFIMYLFLFLHNHKKPLPLPSGSLDRYLNTILIKNESSDFTSTLTARNNKPKQINTEIPHFIEQQPAPSPYSSKTWGNRWCFASDPKSQQLLTIMDQDKE